MLSFKTTPPDYSPTWRRAECRVASDPAQTIDIALRHTLTGELLGTRRFVNITEAAFDVSPIIRRTIRFAPQPAPTGYVSAVDRKIPVTVTAALTDDPSQKTRSPTRVYFAGADTPAMLSLLTTMPTERLIAPGEWDEATLLFDLPPKTTVTAQGPAGTVVRTYAPASSGLQLFRLDTSDFPGAERITVEFDTCGKVEYTVVPAVQGARRIAWHTRAGSIEHYTFPIEPTASVETQKTRIRSFEGPEVVSADQEQRLRLRSAYETRTMLEALAEILVAPEVWIVDSSGYRKVDVLSDRAVVHRHGTLSCLEIEIRLCRTTDRS
ncbi:MAG: hypothetical protein K2N04_05100 [Alistipes sp.]|nr:hypothetical protein [Alistipes sp.]